MDTRAKANGKAQPRWTAAELSRMKRERHEEAMRALDELQRRGREAGITEEDVRREVEAFRAGR